ncbi:hypothetical protein [Nonomuraea jabiensis]|uniref:hypothetical protein n=1 Tax=Nonomuraea jabiensis TaxID=882448 RepID=UPI003D75CCB9
MAGSPARKEVARVGVKVVPDTSGFGSDLKSELAKHANTELDIKIEGDFAEFEADLKRITSGKHTVNIDVKADVAAAEAAINRVAQDRTSKLKLDVETSAIDSAIAKAQQSLSGLNSRKLTINVDLDAAAAEAKIKLLTRTETKKIRVDLDTSSFDRAKDLISDLGSAITSALSGAASLVSGITSAFSTLSSSASSAASTVSSSGSAISGVLGNVSGLALQVVGSIAQLAGMAVVITGVITLLGSLVVAAGAAVVALAGVAIGVAGLVILPALFAGIAASLISKSDELKTKFGELGATLRATVQDTAQPMLDALAQGIGRVNEAVSEGGPLYDGLALAFQSAAQAITPLTEGLIGFAENALTGIANALENLNAAGFWDGIATGLATLGEAFGNFFNSLSTWAPEFSSSFQAVADAANILLPSLANLSGAFASFAPDVILSLANAFKTLFDAFAANKDVYGAAAQALADGLNRMAPAFEKLTAALAQMTPGIMDAVAAGLERIVTSLDADTITNLGLFAQAMVDLGVKAAEAAISMTSTLGEAWESIGRGADITAGILKETSTLSIEHLKGLVTQADSTREAANNLVRQLQVSWQQVIASTKEAADGTWDAWKSGIDRLQETNQTGLAQLNEDFRTRFGELMETVNETGGQLSPAWKAQMQTLIDETRASGGPLGQSMADNMQKILDALSTGGAANIAKVQEMLRGMENQVQASQIAQALGIKMDEASNKVTTSGQAIQSSFAAVMNALPEMVRSAKTPEELQTKLDQMTQIVSGAAPAMGTAFKALGDSMVKGIADADVTSATTKLMTSIQTAITAGVPGVVSAFQQLPTQLATAMATGSTGVTAAVTTQMTNITQAVTTGVTNAVTAYKKLPTDMAAASDFSATTQKIDQAMKDAQQKVTDGCKKMIDEFNKLPPAAEKAGKLGNFAANIKSEMSQAEQAVTSAVQNILAQLESINRTFTTNIVVNVTRNEDGGGGDEGGNFAPNSFAPDGGFAPMLMSAQAVEPMALSTMATPFEAQAQTAEAIMSYARAMRDQPAMAGSGGSQAQKVYNINVYAAPNVPTEEQLRKQLAYADALYE